MSTATEIEKAIMRLSDFEMEKLKAWWTRFSEKGNEAKRASLKATGGYLTDADNDFVTATEEAGKDIPESHEW